MDQLTPDREEEFLVLSEAYSKEQLTNTVLDNNWCLEQLWALFFKFKPFETRTKKFAYRVSTNGYEACLLFNKKVQVEPKSKKSKHDPPTFDSFVGIDPGKTFVLTSFDGNQTTQVSTKSLRFDGKVIKQTKWNLRKRNKYGEYHAMINTLPSLKTPDLDSLKAAIGVYLLRSKWLFKFCNDHPFKKWRFKTFRFQRKALSAVCRSLITKGQRTCVGVGDWSRQDGLKGLPKAPVERLKREFRHHAVKVVEVDEYRTSMTCSECKKSKVENLKFRSQESVLSKSHQVVRCTDNECAICWQRDLNAAKNIHFLLKRVIQGEDRSGPFQRGSILH